MHLSSMQKPMLHNGRMSITVVTCSWIMQKRKEKRRFVCLRRQRRQYGTKCGGANKKAITEKTLQDAFRAPIIVE